MWLVSVDPPAHVVYSKMGNLLWSKGNSEDGKDLQKREGDHTDHTGSIVSLMACIFDLKEKFLFNWTPIKIVHYRRAIALVW